MLGTENPVPLTNQASENKKQSFLQSPSGTHVQAATTASRAVTMIKIQKLLRHFQTTSQGERLETERPR